MSIGPSVDTNVRAITFEICSTDASPIYTQAPLAASTGGIEYKTGLLLAQLTSGADSGKFINFDSVAGTDGQDVFVGVLMDNQLPVSTAAQPLAQIAIMLTKGAFVKEQLLYTQIADIAAAVTQRNAKEIIDYNIATTLIYGL